MAKLLPSLIAILALCGLAFRESFAKPTALEPGPDPVAVALSDPADQDALLLRDQRYPQYGFGDYDDYYDEGSSRHYKKKNKHKPVYVPIVIQGGHGCRSHGSGCEQSYHKPSHHNSGGGSFASASAGSFGSGNHGGSNSQAQSTSLSFGPITISTAQAQSSRRKGGYGGYGGYGDFGGYDY